MRPYDMLTRKEVAAMARVSVATVKRWIAKGALKPACRTPSGRLLFRRSDVLIDVDRPPEERA